MCLFVFVLASAFVCVSLFSHAYAYVYMCLLWREGVCMHGHACLRVISFNPLTEIRFGRLRMDSLSSSCINTAVDAARHGILSWVVSLLMTENGEKAVGVGGMMSCEYIKEKESFPGGESVRQIGPTSEFSLGVINIE